MVRAVWNGKVIAESDRTEVVEGNHYFSPEHVRREYLAPSDHHRDVRLEGRGQLLPHRRGRCTKSGCRLVLSGPKACCKEHFRQNCFWKGVRIES